jgi:hypothetical protein
VETHETDEVLESRSIDFCWILCMDDTLGNKSIRSYPQRIILMLTLYTSGYKYSKSRCTNAVEWFIAKYLPRHKIEININHRGLIREGVYGWCTVTDCDWRPREFEIELHNRMNSDHYLQTLFHELWHVYQHVMGNLKDSRGKRLWRGIDHTETDYENQPWEVEARQMEELLYIEYLGLNDFVYSFPNRLTQP